MLKNTANQRMFWGFYVSLIIIQLLLAVQTDLFGDEAFYWLESQFWQWSYSEIPGFVPWLNGLSTTWMPQHPFFLRLPYLIAGWSIPWLSILLAKQVNESLTDYWQVALLSLCLPLLGLIGVLAIADIWLIVFTLLSILFWLRLIRYNRRKDALYLGLILMLCLNVHIRFWFIMALALPAAFVVYQQALLKQKSLWIITLPCIIIGLIPILIFNIENNFPLISFQLGERNPWQFQLSHFWFFLMQIVITTPWVFYLCLKSLRQPLKYGEKNQSAARFIQFLAVSYWLLYALLGFFSDNLRTNIHWPLPAYLLLLIVAASQSNHLSTLKKWAAWSGGFTHIFFLVALYGLIQFIPVDTNPHKQIISNAVGWQELVNKTKALKLADQSLIADNFMTSAALNYYWPKQQPHFIPALPHPMNQKHGRHIQLELMDLLYREAPKKTALVVIEHTALKLSQQIPFYQSSCDQLNGLKLIDQLSIRSGAKLFYFFYTNTGDCDIPPIVYHDFNQGIHSGWIMTKRDPNNHIKITTASNSSQQETHFSIEALGENELFKTVSAEVYQRIKYHIAFEGSVQLNIQQKQGNLLSQRFYP